MLLIGVDYHPSFQTISYFVGETGEYDERELNHSDGQAEKFYRDLKQRGICVRVGMQAAPFLRTSGRHATKVHGRGSRHCYAITWVRRSYVDKIQTWA